jgi:hypothetical protein
MTCRNSNGAENDNRWAGAFLQPSLYLQTSVRHVPEGPILTICGLLFREPILHSAGQTDHQCTPTAYRKNLEYFHNFSKIYMFLY